MIVSVIDAGNFKLDGGSMFGVVPKSIWQKSIPADENNMCNFNMRCLLIEYGDRLVLIDTGMGEKQPEKWQNYYYRNGEANLKSSIKNAGYDISEVTDVILSHLHFDHCGGAVEWNSTKKYYQPTFSKANYWTHSEHYSSALSPNARERATFLHENIAPLAEAGQLSFIDKTDHNFSDNFEFIFVDGHTEKMIMVVVDYQGKKIAFAADTVPTFAHIHVPFVMSYDIAPLVTMTEKDHFLNRAISEDLIVLFDHDIKNQAAKIIKTDRGFRAETLGNLSDFL